MSSANRSADWTSPAPLDALGPFALWGGAILLVMRQFERGAGLPGMPRFWYTNDALWQLVGGVLLAVGVALSFRGSVRTERRTWAPTRGGIRFREVRLLSHDRCPLCDTARELLRKYDAWLPRVMEIDIHSDPRLVEKFGEYVPVVLFDGKVRFRGRVSEPLLRRLIEATPPLP